jgi:phospholipid/cholesterol/gamma-HCH transport system substrate-binding protein
MDSSHPTPPPVANLELKAQLLLLLLLVLLLGSAAYVLVARGFFERTQQLVLIADDSEGIAVGMDLTFSGFPIGRVGRIELSPDGNARILVDVPLKDAQWLRTSSVFTMESGLIGGTRLRAFSGILSDPPMPDGSERRVLRGDAKAEIPLMVASVRELVSNLRALTDSDAALSVGLRNMQNLTEKLNGRQGALGLLMGNDKDAHEVVATLAHANALLSRLDNLAANANQQVFGPSGVTAQTKATVVQLNGLLADARNSLKKFDLVLQEAQAIGANTREATNDLVSVRAELESSLRKVEHLLNDINRKWPLRRDTEVKLP